MKKIEMFVLGRKAALAEIPRDFSSDDWGTLQRRFATACGARKPGEACVSCITLYPDQYWRGVWYSWGLASADGAWFEVYRMPHHSKEQVQRCVSNLRHTQDVVLMSTARITQWLPMGKAGLGDLQRDPLEALDIAS